MIRKHKKLIYLAVLITLAAIIVWQATGGDYYTKYEIIHQVKVPLDQNDPLVASGFYDEDFKIETVQEKGFRFGLLPTPSGLLDKHIISVISLITPFWIVVILLILINYRRRSRKESAAS
jgi:hypothetical protein